MATRHINMTQTTVDRLNRLCEILNAKQPAVIAAALKLLEEKENPNN